MIVGRLLVAKAIVAKAIENPTSPQGVAWMFTIMESS